MMLNSDKTCWRFAITIYFEQKTNCEYTGIPPYFMFILILSKAMNVSMILAGTGRVCISLDQVLQVRRATRLPGYSLSMPDYQVVRRGSCDNLGILLSLYLPSDSVQHELQRRSLIHIPRKKTIEEKERKGTYGIDFTMGSRLIKLRCCGFQWL